jgi:zinc protease
MRILPTALAFIAALAATSCVQPPVKEAASPTSAARQFVSEVHRTVLPNGLTVLYREQKGSGVVAINTWVKAGYFHEPDEVAGMAHLFEHMFFKGSRKFPEPAAISQAIAAAGGDTNAGTIYDNTHYDVVVPKESFAKGVEIQADAIANPLFDAAELKKEAEVVIEESNRKLDNPAPVAFERMLATLFTQHRVRRWRIGSNEVLRNIKRADLVAFFDTLYRPENIIVSVVGDVPREEAIATVTRNFGAIPRGTLRKEFGPKEPPQKEFRFGRSEADIKESYVVLGFQTVPENHPDEVTLGVLARVLGQGRSSRLYRAAVSPDGAGTVSASHYTFEDIGIFSLSATMQEKNRVEVERRMVVEVERLKAHGPTAYELAQAKNIGVAAFLAEMESALDQAQLLAGYEARGSYRDIARRLDEMQAVTAEQVREAARRYLDLQRSALYHHQPKGTKADTREAAWQRLSAATASAPAAPESVALPELGGTVRAGGRDAPLATMALSNGATLAVQQRRGAPLVATGIYFRGGRTQEDAANAGITRLMQNAMRRGTTSRSGEQVDREIEFYGTQIGTVGWEDGFGFTFTTTPALYDPVLAIAADVLANPAFPEAGVAREKAVQVAAVRRSLDSATDRPVQLFRAAMFPDHPYGLPDLGTEATLAAIDRAALQAWWKRSIAMDRALVVVVGDVDANDVKRVLEEKLAAVPRSAGALRPLAAPRLPQGVKEVVEPRERKQTSMIVAFPAVPPSHPDWSALRLMQSLTSGLGGTMFEELRSRQSLAYVTFAQARAYAMHGVFIGYLAGEASKEQAARTGLLTELRKLGGEGVQEADVARAKSALIGNARINRETSGARVAEYGRNYVLGLPLDAFDRTLAEVPALTVADLRRVGSRYFARDDFVFVAVRGVASK